MGILLDSGLLYMINAKTTVTAVPGYSTGNSAWQLVWLVLLLIFILVAAYYTSRFIGGVKLGQMKNSNFQLIDTYRISPNKVMQIVKVGNKFVVIAIGKDTVNLITELDESEITLKESIMIGKPNFKQIFDKLRNNKS